MSIDLLNTEYTHSRCGDFKNAFDSLTLEEKKRVFKGLVLKSFPKSFERSRKAGLSEEKAKEDALLSLGIHWAINLDCDGDEYWKVYRPYILNG